MSDWIPVPEIENVLIVLATLAETPEDSAAAPVMALLEKLKTWHGAAVYVFHDPPEAGEVLEDVDPDMAARFALAAQMSDVKTEVCRDAFRRVFSRATVQRVVLLADDHGDIGVDRIDELFSALDGADLIWDGIWPNRFALGMREFRAEIFSDLDAAEQDLRKTVEAFAVEQSLALRMPNLM